MKRASNISIKVARFRLSYSKLWNSVLLDDEEILFVERVSAFLELSAAQEELDAVGAYTDELR